MYTNKNLYSLRESVVFNCLIYNSHLLSSCFPNLTVAEFHNDVQLKYRLKTMRVASIRILLIDKFSRTCMRIYICVCVCVSFIFYEKF
jgi:hypothetical protein